MKKTMSSFKSGSLILTVILGAFVILNVVFLSGMKFSVENISEKTEATCDKYITIKDELADEKQKLAFMEHVLEIKNILDSFGSRTSSYSNMDFAYLLAKESFDNNLDPYLVLALIKTESSFRTSVVSHKGAIGLMQILPNTAQYVSQMHEHIDLADSKELFEPDMNVMIGINYLSYLVSKFENQKYAIIAYNMGPTNLIRKIKNGESLPERYYRKVMKHYRQILSLSGRV